MLELRHPAKGETFRTLINPMLLQPDQDLCKHKPADLTDPGRTITFQLADSMPDKDSACMLVNKRYAWRGYGDNHQIPVAPLHYTFSALDDEEVIGTITLAVDSPKGLAADKIFKEEIDQFRRRPGTIVCELTKFAFDAAIPSKKLLASLFHIVFIYGIRQHQCTDLFIEVNPRHRRYYEAMLGFKPIGKMKTNESVSAPSHLMRLKVADIRARINACAQTANGTSSRSLYPLFFSPKREDAIYAQLIGGDRGFQIQGFEAEGQLGQQAAFEPMVAN